MYSKQAIKKFKVYKILTDYLYGARKHEPDAVKKDYQKASKEIREAEYWNDFSQKYYAEYKGIRKDPEVDMEILDAIELLFTAIYMSFDSYEAEENRVEGFNIDEHQLYRDVKERFDRANRLLEEIA